MKFPHWFLLFLLSFLFLTGLIIASTPPTNASGKAHSQFSSMQESGESVITSTFPKWLAYTFGAGIIGLFAFSAILGIRRGKKEKNPKIFQYLFIGFGLYFLMYALMLLAYQGYHYETAESYFLGFPIPTAWMLFGVGLIPFFMTYFYVTRFDEWVISPEEIEEFKKIKDQGLVSSSDS